MKFISIQTNFKSKIFDWKIKKEESIFFIKSKLIHQTVPDCDIPMEISSDEECAMKEQFREHIMSKYFPCLNVKIGFR
jgi:hypothetical protein